MQELGRAEVDGDPEPVGTATELRVVPRHGDVVEEDLAVRVPAEPGDIAVERESRAGLRAGDWVQARQTAEGDWEDVRSLNDLRWHVTQQLMSGQPLTLQRLADFPVITYESGYTGRSHIDESLITGESLPVEKAEGDAVFAGTVVESGALDIRTERLGTDTTFARIIALVENAESVQAPVQKLADNWDYIYEPSAAELLDTVLQRYVESQVYQAVVENVASEQSARMVAMKAATDNAGKIINGLQLAYNKARQASITKELAEIVGGAAAV